LGRMNRQQTTFVERFDPHPVRLPRAKISACYAGTVLGLSKYATPHDFWRVKTDLSERDNSISSEASHGISLEPIVKQLYGSIQNTQVEKAPFRNHHEEEWKKKMGAEPDGISKDPSGEFRLLEIKCPVFQNTWKFIPVDYLAQIQFQMDVWNVPSCDFVGYFHISSTIKIWRVYRSLPYIKWMRERLDHFISSVDNLVAIDNNILPFIHYDAVDLAENGHQYNNIKTTFTRKQLPPKVHSPIILDRILTDDEKNFVTIKLTPPLVPLLPPWVTRILVYIAYFLIFVIIFLSFIPVVRIDESQSDS
jgi:putative phage-type endonuclease